MDKYSASLCIEALRHLMEEIMKESVFSFNSDDSDLETRRKKALNKKLNDMNDLILELMKI